MTIQKFLRKSALATAIATAPVVAMALGAPYQNDALGHLTSAQLDSQNRELQNYAAAYGATVSPIKLQVQQIAAGVARGGRAQALGVQETPSSCTATATVSVPGGTGVTLSATASTCEQAISMLMSAIRRYVGRPQ